MFTEVSRRYEDKGVRFLGVFVLDTEGRARDFLRTHRVSFPTGYDWRLDVAAPLGFRGMPYTVLISRRGQVARRFFGPIGEKELVAAIETLLTDR